MNNTKKINSKIIAIIFMIILLVLSIAVNLSFAYFTDSNNSAEGLLTFGTIEVKASVYEENSYVVEDGKIKFSINATEAAGDKALRTIVIENVDGKLTENFVLRLSGLSNVIVNSTNMVTVGVPSGATVTGSNHFTSSNWLTGLDGKQYYSKNISLPQSSKIYIPVQINFDKNLSAGDITSNSKVEIEIEIIQYVNEGWKSWTDKPDAWNPTTTFTASATY